MTLLYIALAGALIYFNRKGLKRFWDKLTSTKSTKSESTYKEPKYTYTTSSNKYDGFSRADYYGRNDSQKSSSNFARLLLAMGNDFKNNPYSDKFDAKLTNVIVSYYFENGRLIRLRSDGYLLDSSGSSMQLSAGELRAYLDFIKSIIDISIGRPYSNHRNRYQRNFNEHINSPFMRGYSKNKTNKKYTEEQLKYQEKFWKLKDTNDLRMEQLKKMKKNDPEREGLVNELNVVKNVMKKYFEKSGLKIGDKKPL